MGLLFALLACFAMTADDLRQQQPTPHHTCHYTIHNTQTCTYLAIGGCQGERGGGGRKLVLHVETLEDRQAWLTTLLDCPLGFNHHLSKIQPLST